ncbi:MULTISPECIES: PorP/SprF family type IX secretion system membrane protein [unclassified Paraflavitalea]|uniref:PorP/SprF family type IX secretion system membrane protein n=1 Tax=unclassified Paraflavitalea TaxID=2798305 RepID=UPI003D33F5B8
MKQMYTGNWKIKSRINTSLKVVVMLIASFCLQEARAQDLHFSQFFEAPLLRNPSLAGIFTGDYRIQGVYRDQWNSFTNAYRTGSFNGEYKMPVGGDNDYITTGLQAFFDKSGTAGLTTTQLLPAVNYHKSLSDYKTSYLSLGFMGGMIRKSIDASKMTTDNQYSGGTYNPGLPTGETFTNPNFTTWDASVGMAYNAAFGEKLTNSYFFGLAYHHLNRPKNSFYRDPAVEINPKFVVNMGMKLAVDEYSYLTLQADVSKQGGAQEIIGGAMYSYKLGLDPDAALYTIHVGGYLRWKDAFIPVVKLDVMNTAFAISYDVNVSALKTASQGRGGFELSIVYSGFLDRENSSKYKVLCPKF